MRSAPIFTVLAVVAALTGGSAAAQDGPPPEQQALNARQSHMQLYGFHLGPVGGMAQGNIPFDAAVATAAAQNLSHLAQMDQSLYWLPGTSSEEMEESRARPAIWEDMEDFAAKRLALAEATEALVAAAGTDQAALGAAMGGVGQACAACHETYRVPMN